MTDIVEIGSSEPGDSEQPISYAIGPGTLARMLGVIARPAALGIASLGLALATLMVVNPASEIGAVHLFTNSAPSSGQLLEFRWASGIRMGLALIAVVLAVSGVRLLLGARPRLTVGVDDLDADAETLDRMEAEVLAQTAATAPTWIASLLGGGLVLSGISLALNAAAFGYSMASHVPLNGG